MTDSSRKSVDSFIEQSMDLFERADVGAVRPFDLKKPERLLAALDGSAQDHATVLMAKQLHDRLGCAVAFHPAPTDEFRIESDTFDVLQSIGAAHVDVAPGIETNYDRILAAAETCKADLLLAPCPFGRDFESLGEDSTGTVIDVLTARSRIPFVAIRRPDATGRDPMTHLRIILTGANPAAELAASWAVSLVQPQGRLELLLLVEHSFYENFKDTLASLQPGIEVDYEDLEHALAKKYAALNASLQHAASEIGFTYELLVRYEADDEPITPEDPRTHPALMVLALQRTDHDSQGEIHDFVRRSPHPVLTVAVD